MILCFNQKHAFEKVDFLAEAIFRANLSYYIHSY